MNLLLLATILSLTNPLVIAGIAVAATVVAYFLVGFLYKKFPAAFKTFLNFTSNKDNIKFVYYILANNLFPKATKEQKDKLFNILVKEVNTAEELCIAGELTKAKRKLYVMRIVEKELVSWGIEYDEEVKAFSSQVIEMIITYLDLRFAKSL